MRKAERSVAGRNFVKQAVGQVIAALHGRRMIEILELIENETI